MGIIGFEQLKIQCIVGANDAERVQHQEIVIDVKVKTDFTSSVTSDSINDTICYSELADLCQKIAITKRSHLLETLASAMLDAILKMPHIEWAWIRIKKPSALPEAAFAFVELERHKGAK